MKRLIIKVTISDSDLTEAFNHLTKDDLKRIVAEEEINRKWALKIADNVNLCTKCTKYRKRQGKHTIKELKKYNRYRQPGCKLWL